uniref:Protein E7 n=1 Tax=Miniopterus bat papillomavirus TaxID=3141888 RepID=A0AAU7E2I0_9PAPI
MRGERPTIPDIVLSLGVEPCVLDLQCYEQFEEDEEEQQVHQVPTEDEVACDTFSVESVCGHCAFGVLFVVQASQAGIRRLQSLLVEGELRFVCFACARENVFQAGPSDGQRQ